MEEMVTFPFILLLVLTVTVPGRSCEALGVMPVSNHSLCLSAEVSTVESRCSRVGFQAAHPLHFEPQPEGCSQLWALPASLQRPGREVSG